ncbi:hypothetical protein [Liquorilactobacillus hordei]|uniref:hypothetical protein n=1 Tax=Liquorilactobacillus hordei TaxID=468911 RepID=UPI0039ED3053
MNKKYTQNDFRMVFGKFAYNLYKKEFGDTITYDNVDILYSSLGYDLEISDGELGAFDICGTSDVLELLEYIKGYE